jgi:hypothetical protein
MVRQANRRITADIMTASSSRSSQPVGFLTVCEHEAQGVFGGYLVLNTAGRPLEFHCTAPVRPSRAQEILYGATLQAYLYGEQIGQALLEKAKTTPLVVFTDAPAVLTVRGFTSLPVACVLTPEAEPTEPNDSSLPARRLRLDEGRTGPPTPFALRLHTFHVGSRQLAVLQDYEEDAELIAQRWEPLAGDFDLREPFGRIREAVDEARRSATR